MSFLCYGKQLCEACRRPGQRQQGPEWTPSGGQDGGLAFTISDELPVALKAGPGFHALYLFLLPTSESQVSFQAGAMAVRSSELSAEVSVSALSSMCKKTKGRPACWFGCIRTDRVSVLGASIPLVRGH